MDIQTTKSAELGFNWSAICNDDEKNISNLESTGIQKKCLGLTPIFFHEVYPKDHKIAHMEIFDVYLGEKF